MLHTRLSPGFSVIYQCRHWRMVRRLFCTSYLFSLHSSNHFVSPPLVIFLSILSLSPLTSNQRAFSPSLFIISRRKLHLATVQLFPFIPFVMHRRHEIDINSGSKPPFSARVPRSTLLHLLFVDFPPFPLYTRSPGLCDDEWTIKGTTMELFEMFTDDRLSRYSSVKTFYHVHVLKN